MRDYGCGDNSCMFGPPGGMGTNGGCRCLKDLPGGDRHHVQRGVRAIRKELAAAKAQLEQEREARLKAEAGAAVMRESLSACVQHLEGKLPGEHGFESEEAWQAAAADQCPDECELIDTGLRALAPGSGAAWLEAARALATALEVYEAGGGPEEVASRHQPTGLRWDDVRAALARYHALDPGVGK